MSRALTALCALLAMAALIAGCGGDGDPESPATEQSPTTSATNPEPKAEEGPEPGKAQKGQKSTGQAAKIIEAGGAKTPPGKEPAKPKEFEAPAGGDDSIQTYGSVAEGEEEEEAIAAMRSFFAALAELDYPAICAGLTRSNRESLQLFLKAKKRQGDCEDVLEELLLAQTAPEARKAANGSVLEVRIEDGNAFVLFTPEGGAASYFVMKEEDGRWRSTGLAAGAPFDPTAG